MADGIGFADVNFHILPDDLSVPDTPYDRAKRIFADAARFGVASVGLPPSVIEGFERAGVNLSDVANQAGFTGEVTVLGAVSSAPAAVPA